LSNESALTVYESASLVASRSSFKTHRSFKC